MQTGSSNESSRTRAKAKTVTEKKAPKRTKADPKSDTLHLKAKHFAAMTTDAIDITSMIATAAYYRAAQRGFAPGHELDDWLQAEQLVHSQIPS